MPAVLTALHLVFIMHSCLSQSALNVRNLTDDLMTLGSNIRPTSNLSHPTVVNVSFHLMSIVTLDTAHQKLVSNGWMNVLWQSDYHTWVPAQYGGVMRISPPADQMWRPRLTIKNTLKDLRAIGEGYIVLFLNSDGWVEWYPAERFETFCQLDVTFFPLDKQRCIWDLFSWGQGSSEVILQPIQPDVNMDSYHENGEWQLIDSKSSQTKLLADGQTMSRLVYEVTLQRKPILLAMTVVLPMMLLAVINVFVFTIPSEAGEKLAYSMTAFLTFGVFMSFIVDLMPSSTQTVSIMTACMSSQVIMSALYVLLCILSLRLFHKDDHKHPVPDRIQTTIIYLEVMLCLGPPSRPKAEVTSSDGLDNGFSRAEVKGSRLKGHLDRWAKKRQVKEEAYRQPQDMTWQRVSRSLDKVFFRFFLFLVIINHAGYTCTMVYVYIY